jgi:RimJ/RimL family protein N-acetyltransferase
VSANELYLRTARLDLIAATVDQLSAELEDPQKLGALLGAEILPSWPPGEYDRIAMEYFRTRLVEGGSAVAGWYGWYGIRRATAELPPILVVSAGYFGPPTALGSVDIGYSVVPEWRRHGYATETVNALSARALEVPGVHRVLAEAHMANAASIAVLKRCGFRWVGGGHEPTYFRFQRDRPAEATPEGAY